LRKTAYSKGERKAIHLALEDSKGDVTQASVLLNIPKPRLYNFIRSDKEFNARWSKNPVEPPTKSEVVHRPNPSVQFADRLKDEERALSHGLEAVGIVGKAKEEAIAAAAFSSIHLQAMRQMTAGGILKDFTQLGVLMDEIKGELSAGQEEEREKTLYEALFNTVRYRNEINRDILKGALIDAQIKAKQDEKGRPQGKPGFTPINNIVVQAGTATKVELKDAKGTSNKRRG
jgi:hypothetical protein